MSGAKLDTHYDTDEITRIIADCEAELAAMRAELQRVQESARADLALITDQAAKLAELTAANASLRESLRLANADAVNEMAEGNDLRAWLAAETQRADDNYDEFQRQCTLWRDALAAIEALLVRLRADLCPCGSCDAKRLAIDEVVGKAPYATVTVGKVEYVTSAEGKSTTRETLEKLGKVPR